MLGTGISSADENVPFEFGFPFLPSHAISLDVPHTLAQSLLDTMQKADVQTIAFPLAVCREWIVCVFVVLV